MRRILLCIGRKWQSDFSIYKDFWPMNYLLLYKCTTHIVSWCISVPVNHSSIHSKGVVILKTEEIHLILSTIYIITSNSCISELHNKHSIAKLRNYSRREYSVHIERKSTLWNAHHSQHEECQKDDVLYIDWLRDTAASSQTTKTKQKVNVRNCTEHHKSLGNVVMFSHSKEETSAGFVLFCSSDFFRSSA
jgi:hypothetical protein